jgi:hypothetical protein
MYIYTYIPIYLIYLLTYLPYLLTLPYLTYYLLLLYYKYFQILWRGDERGQQGLSSRLEKEFSHSIHELPQSSQQPTQNRKWGIFRVMMIAEARHHQNDLFSRALLRRLYVMGFKNVSTESLCCQLSRRSMRPLRKREVFMLVY